MTRTTLWLVSWCAIVVAVFSSLVEAGWRNAEAVVIVVASVVNLFAGAPWRGRGLRRFYKADGSSVTMASPEAVVAARKAAAVRLAALEEALEESVRLQSHQARLLNQYDGGERRQFADREEWIARLAECGKEACSTLVSRGAAS